MFDTERVCSFHLWCEHHSVVEVFLVHDLAQFSGAIWIRYGCLHVEWIGS